MASHSIPVLLIEDNAGDARYIREMLTEAGDVRFELTQAARLADGLDCLRRQRYGVVLLDLSLPDSDGLDTFRTLHEQTRENPLPVVVLTGLSDTQLALQAVEERAQDYLVKNDVNAGRLVHALRFAISRFQQQHAVEQSLRANEAEMEVASQIWRYLLPRQAPQLPGFSIHGRSYAASKAGGDFFDYLPLGKDQVGIVVGDVTSHGVGPALLMAATRAYLRAFSKTARSVDEILALTNRVLVDDVDDRNVTLVLVALDGATRTLRYASAGHWPGYVLDAAGNVRAQLLSTDLALGIWPDSTFPPAEPVELHPGDLVLLYSDGIIEARPASGKLFGRERMVAYVREHQDEPADAIVTGLHAAVREWEGGEEQGDDITVVVIKVE